MNGSVKYALESSTTILIDVGDTQKSVCEVGMDQVQVLSSIVFCLDIIDLS